MLKKIAALVLAGAMVIGSIVPAMAADPVTYTLTDGKLVSSDGKTYVSGWTTNLDGTYNVDKAVEAGTYTIKVTNTNENASIAGKTYKAYKLFDMTYEGMPVPTGDQATTVLGDDTTAHTYTIKKDSAFYDVTILSKYFKLQDKDDANKDYVTLIPSTTSEIQKDENNQDIPVFTTEKAYALVQDYMTAGKLDNATPDATGTAGANEEFLTIDVSAKGPGYYMVAGDGEVTQEDGSKKTVTAAVAVTSTDPKAEIKAKLDGPKLEKRIDENPSQQATGTFEEPKDAVTDTNGTITQDAVDGDLKYDEHAVGDTVPFILKTEVPNLTGYEKYYFYVTDTMSAGLTLLDEWDDADTATQTDAKNGFAVKIGNTTLTRTTKDAANKMVDDPDNAGQQIKDPDFDPALKYYVNKVKDKDADGVTVFEVVFCDFIQYKGDIVTEKEIDNPEYDAAAAAADENYSVPEKIPNPAYGTSESGTYTGEDIIITYSAKVNDAAVIGELGNPNTAKLTFSNKPDVQNGGKPGEEDKPDDSEDAPKVTEETPNSTTITYLTGLHLLKYDLSTLQAHELAALADAIFELSGTNLNELVESSTEYFRKALNDEELTAAGENVYYLLKDGRYTKDAPVEETTEVVIIDGKEHKILHKGNADQYVNPNKAEYIKDTAKDWKRTPASGSDSVKYTVKTDDNGVMTFTGLRAGEYTLKELEAPEGYNILPEDLYFEVIWTAPRSQASTDVTENETATWSVIFWKEGETKPVKPTDTEAQDYDTKLAEYNKHVITPNQAMGNLFPYEVGNAKGIELPSTGGIGTTLFYAGGAILVLLAGVLLVSKRRIA